VCVCVCVCVRERERERCCRSTGGIGSFFRKIHCTSTILSDTQNVRKFFCHTTKSKSFVAEERTNGRERVGARASERASEQHSRRPQVERDREREKTPGNSGSPGPPCTASPGRIGSAFSQKVKDKKALRR